MCERYPLYVYVINRLQQFLQDGPVPAEDLPRIQEFCWVIKHSELFDTAVSHDEVNHAVEEIEELLDRLDGQLAPEVTTSCAVRQAKKALLSSYPYRQAGFRPTYTRLDRDSGGVGGVLELEARYGERLRGAQLELLDGGREDSGPEQGSFLFLEQLLGGPPPRPRLYFLC